MRRFAIALVLVFVGCGSLHESYVQQDRDNYETLWPRIEQMLETSDLSDDQKMDVTDRGASWDLWTAEGLEAIKKEKEE